MGFSLSSLNPFASNSDTSSSSTSTTTNQYDQRNVVGDGSTSTSGGSTSDSGNLSFLTTNWADYSTTDSNNSSWLSTTNDSGNTSNLTTNWTDSRTTIDSSTNNTNIVNTVVDGGSMELAGQAVIQMGKTAKDAFAFGTGAIGGMQNVSNTAITANTTGFMGSLQALGLQFSNAIGLIGKSEVATQASNTQAINSAMNAFGQSSNMVQTAYADAKGRGALTDKIIILAIVASALVAYKAMSK